MNENDGGTPNPLNPTPSTEPTPTPEPTPEPAPEPKVGLETEPVTKVESEGVVEIETAHEAAMNPSPLDRPMEQAQPEVTEQPKKKKTGLIIGILVALLIATGCGVAALLLFMNNDDDAVAKAIDKLINGNLPTNTVVDGTIDVALNDSKSAITNLKLDLNSELVVGSMINSTTAKLSVEAKNRETITAELNEIYGTDGDLYLKIDGVSDLVENSSLFDALFNAGTTSATELEDNCSPMGAGEETNCLSESVIENVVVEESNNDMMEMYATAIKMFEEQWFRISVDELEDLTSETTSQDSLSCVADLIKGANQNSNSLSSNYSKNPFIVSTNKDLPVVSKANPIYAISIDNEKFTNFVDSIKDSETLDEFYSCVGYKAANIDTEELIETINSLPTLYVEIDKDYNFTRLYFTYYIEDGAATATVDLGFSYPTNVNISEPTEYKDLSSALQQMFTSTYSDTDVQTVE